MPISGSFQNRLFPALKDIVKHFGTPFHIYDETGIRETGKSLINTFSDLNFREYFAVKALPNPRILGIMKDMGFGFDCSSVAELILSRRAGGRGEDIMFTSNNTGYEDFLTAAADDGSILNLDDITLIPKVPEMPELVCFRYNPGPRYTAGNKIIGNPAESKYGVSDEQLVYAYSQAKKLGAKRFGMHTMIVSNECNYKYKVLTARMLLEQTERVSKELGIRFEFVNIGGGLGIPYKPEDKPLDIISMGKEITELFREFKKKNGYMPKLFLESGRYMTGPHGVLVVKAINQKNIYRRYIGVDACMSALMRPGMYGAYHHISVLDKNPDEKGRVVDVVGSLCENNDKFAVQRQLPEIEDGDILIIHDTGAHGHAMGFNYNGKLRPKELLLRSDGSVELIRRAETVNDYFATLDFKPDTMKTDAD